jgi:hypothetical protein
MLYSRSESHHAQLYLTKFYTNSQHPTDSHILAKEGLLAPSVAVGLEVFKEMIKDEVTEIIGLKGKHNLAIYDLLDFDTHTLF